jgi:hypothetical protein
MNIGFINHKSDEGAKEFLKKLDESIAYLNKNNIQLDILAGPDYALASKEAMKEKRPNSMHERYEVLRDVKDISKKIPKTILIPGSMFWHEKVKTGIDNAFVSSLLYKSGAVVKEFYKERDADEENRAKNYGTIIRRGIEYKRGNSKNNFFNHDGKKIALEICADHANQDVKNCDLELILAYDTNAGFYINARNDSWSRYAGLCDGLKGESMIQHYDSNNRKFSQIEPITNGSLSIYEI